MISILVPTRERINQLIKSIDTFYEKSSNIDNFEFILGVDNDDIETIDGIKNYISNNNYKNIKLIYFEKLGYSGLHLYFNELVRHSIGELFWTIADDCECRTENWDLILKKYETGFHYVQVYCPQGDVNITGIYNGFSLVPIVSKKWVELTGRIGLNSQTDLWMGAVVRNMTHNGYPNIIDHEYSIVIDMVLPSDISRHTGHLIDLPEIAKELHNDLLKIKAYVDSINK